MLTLTLMWDPNSTRGYTPMYHSLWVSVAANPHENDTRPTKATWGFKRLAAYAQCNRVPCESEEVFSFFFILLEGEQKLGMGVFD